MSVATLARQRGITFGGFIFGAFLFILLGITGIKLIPAYMEAEKIKSVFVSIAQDPNLQKATPQEIKEAFERQSSIDNITAIKGGDIEISSEGGALVLSASYEVKAPLGGNVSLLMTFNPSSAGK